MLADGAGAVVDVVVVEVVVVVVEDVGAAEAGSNEDDVPIAASTANNDRESVSTSDSIGTTPACSLADEEAPQICVVACEAAGAAAELVNRGTDGVVS